LRSSLDLGSLDEIMGTDKRFGNRIWAPKLHNLCENVNNVPSIFLMSNNMDYKIGPCMVLVLDWTILRMMWNASPSLQLHWIVVSLVKQSNFQNNVPSIFFISHSKINSSVLRLECCMIQRKNRIFLRIMLLTMLRRSPRQFAKLPKPERPGRNSWLAFQGGHWSRHTWRMWTKQRES